MSEQTTWPSPVVPAWDAKAILEIGNMLIPACNQMREEIIEISGLAVMKTSDLGDFLMDADATDGRIREFGEVINRMFLHGMTRGWQMAVEYYDLH